MKKLLRIIRKDWEVLLCWTLAVLLALVLLFWVLGIGGRRLSPRASGGAPGFRPLLNERALAFLDPMPALDMQGGNPFVFVVRRVVPKTMRPWRDETATTTTTKTTPAVTAQPRPERPGTGTVATTPPTAAQPRPERPVEPKKKAVRTVEFLGTMATPSGKQSAYILVRDPVTKTESLAFVAKGETLDGVRIQGFGEGALEVLDGAGRVQTIPFGEGKKIVIE